MTLEWIPDITSNSATITLNVNGLGAKSVKQWDGTTNPPSTSIIASNAYLVQYDGTLFRILAAGVYAGNANTWTQTQNFQATTPIQMLQFTVVQGANAHNVYVQGNSQQPFSWADSSGCSSQGAGGSFGINSGTGCPGGTFDAEGGTSVNSTATMLGMKLIGMTGMQTSNTSSVTGATGSPIAITAGRGIGFSSGTGSAGGIGGGVAITAGQGGNAAAGETSGAGGDLTLTAGDVGAGAGTPSTVVGKINLAGHVASTGTNPVLSSCGTGSTISSTATDTKGTVTEGTLATGCVITFNRVYATAPDCLVSSQAGLVFTYTETTTALTITNIGALSSTSLVYFCAQ